MGAPEVCGPDGVLQRDLHWNAHAQEYAGDEHLPWLGSNHGHQVAGDQGYETQDTHMMRLETFQGQAEDHHYADSGERLQREAESSQSLTDATVREVGEVEDDQGRLAEHHQAKDHGQAPEGAGPDGVRPGPLMLVPPNWSMSTWVNGAEMAIPMGRPTMVSAMALLRFRANQRAMGTVV